MGMNSKVETMVRKETVRSQPVRKRCPQSEGLGSHGIFRFRIKGIGPWQKSKRAGGMDHGNDSQERLCDDEKIGNLVGNPDPGDAGLQYGRIQDYRV